MYIFRIVFGIISVLLFSILIVGQTKSQPATSKLEATLRKLDLEAALAIQEKDEARIARFFTKESVTNNPRNGLTLGSSGVIEAARAGVINYRSLDRKIESVQILGNTAILMGSETVVMKARDNGPGETIRRRYTNIWMKTGKDWQIVARHANIICR